MSDKIEKYRKFLRVPIQGDFQCRMLSPHEREGAHDLLFRTYVEMGYWNEEDSQDECLHHHRREDTLCFTVEEGDVPVGTISVFPDGEEGLPLESAFSEEVAMFRSRGRRFVEIGGLVTAGKHPFILHALFKLIHNASLFHLGVDDLFLTIHPKHKSFYEALFCMREVGNSRPLASVGGSPATLLNMDLVGAGEEMKAVFPREPAERDFYRFYYEDRPDCFPGEIYRPDGFPAEIFEAERKEDLQNV